MEYIYKSFIKESDRINGEQKIATISDINLNVDSTRGDVEDIFLSILDKTPKYTFLLGNMFPYYYLENKHFKKNVEHLFELLTAITEVYTIFGEADYKLENNNFIDVNSLINFYQRNGITVLNNRVIKRNNISIIGYNRDPLLYSNKNNLNLKNDVLEFINHVKDHLNNDSYKIFLTNTHKDLLKLELDFFKTLDLIISGQLPKNREMENQGIFIRKEKENINILEKDGLTIIGNSGLNVENEMNSNIGEINLIRIKQKKR